MSDLLPPGSRSGPRAEARRRRRRRRNTVIGAVLALALLVAVVVAVLLVRRDPEPPAAVQEQGRTQSTLLFQIEGADGAALASALLAYDPAGGAQSALLVPPQVIVDVPGTGPLPFGRSLATVSAEGSRNALADLLGVTVDAGLVLDIAALTALVDGSGGLPISVDVPVMAGSTVLIGPGEQQLSGEQVVAFVGYLGPGEPEQTRLARVQEVVDGLLTTLPDTPEQVADLLSGLGDGSQSSLPDDELAQFLVGLAEAEQADDLQYDTLPVISIEAGGGVSAFRLDVEAARALVDRRLAQSVPAAERETGNRVLVLNGVGTPGIGEVVRTRLVQDDFVFVGSRNAPRFDYANTIVLVPEATPEAQLLGERVAAALGVDPDVRTDELGSIADVIVIVGADFVP